MRAGAGARGRGVCFTVEVCEDYAHQLTTLT